MDFELNAPQRELQKAVREFAASHVAPSAGERSRASRWDGILWREFGKRRWPGVVIPEAYGGMGGGAIEHAILVEEMSRVDASLGAALNLLQQTVMAVIAFAPESMKQRYLPLLASGESFSITGITESAAGSKLTDIETTATPDPDTEGGWILHGTKTEVHIPEHVQICLMFAKAPGGITAFLVDTATPGFRVVNQRDIIGLRGLPMSAVAFEHCHVGPDNLLGREGGAYDVFFKSFDLTRIGNAAKCIGIARGAIEDAVAYARERHIGDNVVTDFQGLRWQLGEFDTRIEAARLLTYKAAIEYNQTGRSTVDSARAKLLASTTAMEATTVCLQITGSHGCFTEYPFARYMMDAKVSQITGGTLEVLRNTIARQLLGETDGADTMNTPDPMNQPPIGVCLRPEYDEYSLQKLGEYAQIAETNGFHSVWLAESWGLEATALLSFIGARTSRIKLGTGIVNVFSRTPALLAMMSVTLNDLYDGRFMLGLGSSTKALVEGWHGMTFEHPVPRVRDTVHIVRELMKGGTVDYQGSVLSAKGYRIRVKPRCLPPPIYLAALGPEALRATAEVADGWLPYLLPLRGLHESVESMRDAAEKAGRPRDAVHIAPMVLTAVADDGDAGRAAAREHIAMYMGAMGPHYRAFVASFGFEREVEAIRIAWAAKQHDDARAAVTDEMVDQIAIAGTPDECRARLAAVRAAGADLPILFFPGACTNRMVELALETMASPAASPVASPAASSAPSRAASASASASPAKEQP